MGAAGGLEYSAPVAPARSLEAASDGRYRLIEPLGEGATARVWLAEEADGGALLAAKELRLKSAPDWKSLELFERGAQVLRGLDHPGVPRFRELLREGDDDPRLWLVEEFVPGDDLRRRVRAGETFSRDEVLRIGAGIAEVLAYLHGRLPPIVHRDVKPSNVIVRPDGGVVLIDFGAVQHALRQHTLAGSTVVGSYGYMPPEQFMGRAEPASDLYALGATLVFLTSGREPSELPVREMRLDFRAAVADAGLVALLDELLDPRVERRPQRASDVQRRLLGLRTPTARPVAASEDDVHQALSALLARAEDDGPAPGAPPTLPCPGCGGVMRAVVMGTSDTEVDMCASCHGLWLDHGEIDALVTRPLMTRANLSEIRRQVAALRRAPQAVVYRRCPRCDTPMHRRNFGRVSGIVVDECTVHGMYLDAGELEQIRTFVAMGGLEIGEIERRAEARQAARPRESSVPPALATLSQPVSPMGSRAELLWELPTLIGHVVDWLRRR